MKIVCSNMQEAATLVRRCDAQRTGNHSCYHCLLYPFCTEDEDYNKHKRVEDYIELEVKKHAEFKGTCNCRE